MELVNALRLELKHNHPKDSYLFPRLLVLIPQLVQVCEEFRKNFTDRLFDHSENLSQTHDLLVEIFDLRWDDQEMSRDTCLKLYLFLSRQKNSPI